MPNNLIDVIVSDHREVERAFTELQSGRGSPQQRRELADHVIAELVRHSVAEEQHMYPAARSALPDGDEIADHEIEEHADVERLMKDLEGIGPEDPEFDLLLGRLIQDVRHHVLEEERDLLPRLRQHCSEQQLMELGAKVERAKELAPTHPHPSAPDKPPANKLVDAGAGFVDRIRDRINERSG